MTKNTGNDNTALIKKRHILLLFLFILASLFILAGFETMVNPEDEHLLKEEYIVNSYQEGNKKDPIMSLMSKSFLDIKQVLGEPDEQGYSDWLGPHHYILYQYGEGFIRFCSPESIENEIVVSIVLGPGQEVFGAKVGLGFTEITDLLGEPDYGPELGMDDLYYMEYFEGETNDQKPDILISFVAASMDAPTEQALIKSEAF